MSTPDVPEGWGDTVHEWLKHPGRPVGTPPKWAASSRQEIVEIVASLQRGAGRMALIFNGQTVAETAIVPGEVTVMSGEPLVVLERDDWFTVEMTDLSEDAVGLRVDYRSVP